MNMHVHCVCVCVCVCVCDFHMDRTLEDTAALLQLVQKEPTL